MRDEEANLASGSRRDRASGFLIRICTVIGGAGMFAAVLVDFSDVIARHLGLRILGAIEIVQLCIVAIVSAAIVVATVEDAHAGVHLLTTRMGPRLRRVAIAAADSCATAGFLVLLTGDAWVAADLWQLDERSDLLHLPYAPSRALWCTALASCVILSAFAVRRSVPEKDIPDES